MFVPTRSEWDPVTYETEKRAWSLRLSVETYGRANTPFCP